MNDAGLADLDAGMPLGIKGKGRSKRSAVSLKRTTPGIEPSHPTQVSIRNAAVMFLFLFNERLSNFITLSSI